MKIFCSMKKIRLIPEILVSMAKNVRNTFDKIVFVTVIIRFLLKLTQMITSGGVQISCFVYELVSPTL